MQHRTGRWTYFRWKRSIRVHADSLEVGARDSLLQMHVWHVLYGFHFFGIERKVFKVRSLLNAAPNWGYPTFRAKSKWVWVYKEGRDTFWIELTNDELVIRADPGVDATEFVRELYIKLMYPGIRRRVMRSSGS